MAAVTEPVFQDDLEIGYRLDQHDRIGGTGGAWINSAIDEADVLAKPDNS